VGGNEHLSLPGEKKFEGKKNYPEKSETTHWAGALGGSAVYRSPEKKREVLRLFLLLGGLKGGVNLTSPHHPTLASPDQGRAKIAKREKDGKTLLKRGGEKKYLSKGEKTIPSRLANQGGDQKRNHK